MKDVRPTIRPVVVNTGPPVLPRRSDSSAIIAREATRWTGAVSRRACWCIGRPSATTSCPFTSDEEAGGVHSSGTGVIDAIAAGSIRTTATSLARSATSTLPRTFTAGVSCTSTAVAAPTTCWFVTTSPRLSITTPDA